MARGCTGRCHGRSTDRVSRSLTVCKIKKKQVGVAVVAGSLLSAITARVPPPKRSTARRATMALHASGWCATPHLSTQIIQSSRTPCASRALCARSLALLAPPHHHELLRGGRLRHRSPPYEVTPSTSSRRLKRHARRKSAVSARRELSTRGAATAAHQRVRRHRSTSRGCVRSSAHCCSVTDHLIWKRSHDYLPS